MWQVLLAAWHAVKPTKEHPELPRKTHGFVQLIPGHPRTGDLSLKISAAWNQPTDYSKAELCFKMIECSGNQAKSRDTGGNGSAFGKGPTRSSKSLAGGSPEKVLNTGMTMEDIERSNPTVLAHKRLDVLHPALK